MCKKLFLLSGFLTLWVVLVTGQTTLKNGSLVPFIKTARAFVLGNELSYPIIHLNGSDVLYVSFDELASTAKTYTYRIIHCDANWEKSGYLEVDEYLDGFADNTVDNYDYSLNTTIPYIHYELQIPNNEVQLTKSGNYLLQFYELEFPDSILVQFQFGIYEPLVSIVGEVIRPIGVQYQNTAQELRLRVFHDDLEIVDPFSELSMQVSQNNRPDKVMANVKPLFVKDQELVYGEDGQLMFVGGNEFRTFDIKNFKGIGLGVNDVQFVDTMFFVQLRMDEPRSSKRYFWEQEMNGKQTIYVANNQNHRLSADYAKVFFELSMPEPIMDGSVYVMGAFNQWKIEEANKMTYNYDSFSYECQMDLKQGYYDYCYVMLSNYDGLINEQRIEGSHFQTENDYVIKVYYKTITGNYDRLVGYRVINSKYQ